MAKSRELYEFLDIPWTEAVEQGVQSHFQGGTEYYGVQRGEDFDPNRWRKEGRNKKVRGKVNPLKK